MEQQGKSSNTPRKELGDVLSKGHFLIGSAQSPLPTAWCQRAWQAWSETFQKNTKAQPPHLLFAAIVATHVRVRLTKLGIKACFPEIGQQLDSPALHHVLAVVDHAVEVVEVRLPRVAVPIFLH